MRGEISAIGQVEESGIPRRYLGDPYPRQSDSLGDNHVELSTCYPQPNQRFLRSLTSRGYRGFFPWGVSSTWYPRLRSLTVKSYPQADGWSDDDRVWCKKCANRESRIQRWNFTAEDFEKMRRLNEKPAQWMFHEAEAKNGWVRVLFNQDFCTKTDLHCILDVPHRCHLFVDQDAAKPAESVESAAWWELT